MHNALSFDRVVSKTETEKKHGDAVLAIPAGTQFKWNFAHIDLSSEKYL